jgi:hypothetical protein
MGSTTFAIPAFSLFEDLAGNPLHFMLTALALLTLPLVRISNKRAVYCYAGSVLFGVVLYCVVLKWQPWASRLHTPIFMLSAPLIAAVFVGFHSSYKRLFVCMAIFLFAYSTPFLILNKTRSFVALTNHSILSTGDRLKSYFANRVDLYEDYTAAAKIIMDEGAEEVGLCLEYDDYEYPLWVLVGRHASRGTPRFRHVGVADMSKMKEKQNMLAPGLVVATKRLPERFGCQDGNVMEGREYSVIYDSKHVRVWKLKSP